MKTINKRLIACAVTAALTIPMTAMATNGYFSHGYGIKAKGMAGAGIAYGQDGLAAATNPANVVLTGNRVDFGLDLFIPDRATSVTGAGGANGTYDPNADDMFLIPEFGYISMINNKMAWSVAVYGNGGMNTSYKKPIIAFNGGVGANAGVNLEQLFIAPTFSMKVNETNAIGISLNLIRQTFEAKGIEGFDSALASSAAGSVNNNGADTSTGFNLRLGWTGKITNKVSVGVTYQTEADMSKFDSYKGLFAEQGGFDIPSTYGIGIAIKATPKVNVAIDLTQINYSDVKSISNPISKFAANQLGSNDGPGFGWQDMTVYKIGFDYKMSDKTTIRAGWNHGKQPIPASETMFNLLAPGVVEDHITVGATWTMKNKSELSFAFMYAPEVTVNGSNSFTYNQGTGGAGEAQLSMKQYSLGVAYGWKF